MNSELTGAEIPLILFSGMGADASVFLPQQRVFPNLIVPDWLTPCGDEDLTTYCSRMADSVAVDQPCIVGGASFGGIVALEMTRHINALACILIGSVRGPHQLPKRIRVLRPFTPALDITPLTLLQKFAASCVVTAQKTGADHLAGVTRQFSQADADVLRWSARQILSWDSTYEDVDVRHIHGEQDQVFPLSCVEPDEVVAGAGHVLSMTHGRQVNEFLRGHLSQIAAACPP
ncbi:MAG: alpha/beta hydrolase [Planctomycetota bacterium]